MDDFPAWLKAARVSRGWSQGDLALRVGVGQQTVSSWERGRTVPDRDLLLLVQSAVGAMPGKPSTSPAVGLPRLSGLPFKNLDEYVFEAFCAELAVEVFPGAQVQRFGGRGEKQHGIDVRVVTRAGERIGIQCKRYDKYHPATFRAAAKALDMAEAGVDRCLLWVTAAVTVRVRQEVDKHPDWELWDAEDLARTVAGLDKDVAVRLVDRYFPGLREPFLGVGAPTPWETPEEAFDRFQQGDRYSHRWTLVGRIPELEELVGFVRDDTADISVLGLLVGAAGAGKSRLLKAVCKRLEQDTPVTVRVAPREMPPPEAFELLPATGDLLVMIDDAQEYGAGLRSFIAHVRRHRPEAKILMATRPYGLPAVRDALRGLGVDPTTMPTWSLAELSTTDATALAAEALGPGKQQLAARLAHAAKDCPLLLIAGAVQIREGRLTTSVLQTDEQIRQQLADAFLRAALPDHTGDGVTDVLRAVSLFQPFRENVPVYQQALADLTGRPFYDLVPHLRTLEESGVLLRRGSSLRIVPDLLGDVVLAEAALLPASGASSGYLERAHANVQAHEPLLHALVNTSRVEWQWSHDTANPVALGEPLWAEVAHVIREAGPQQQAAHLPFLRQIGAFQPARTLNLVRWLHEHQADPAVRRGLPPVLDAIAYDLRYIDDACDLLWDLGKDDSRTLNAHPDHALRILTQLASYEPGKPFAYQQAVIRGVQRWATATSPSTHALMPLALLDPVFAAEAESMTQQGWTLTIRRSRIALEQVEGVRRQALDVLFGEYAQQDPWRSARAAVCFNAVLRGTHDAGDTHVIRLLQQLRDRTRVVSPGPVAALGVRRAVDWHLTYGSHDAQQAAMEVLEALPVSVDHDLAVALHTSWWTPMRNLREGEDHEAAASAWDAQLRRTAEATKAWQPQEVWDHLQTLLTDGYAVFGYTPEHAQPFLGHLFTAHPQLAKLISADASHCREQLQQAVVPAAVNALLRQPTDVGIERGKELIASEQASLKRAVAMALADRQQAHHLPAATLASLGRVLADDHDPVVRCLVIQAAGALSATDHGAALELVSAVPMAGDADVAQEVARAVTVYEWLSWTDLPPAQRASLFDQLRVVERLESYEIQKLLSAISLSHGDDVLDLLTARVKHWENTAGENPSYAALPYQWHVPLRLAEAPQRMTYLRRILSWTAAVEPGSRTASRRENHAPDLFRATAGHVDQEAQALLADALRARPPHERRAAAVLLGAVDGDLVWQAPEFVSEVLQAAAAYSTELLQVAGASLHRAVAAGDRATGAGLLHPDDTAIRDNATLIIATLEQGSVEDRFYRSLKESAERRIDWSVREDTEPDHRVW
ncbi:helix-turn-helix domain-containing protein [Streptomyces phaeochromogenes]|uniref:helix-turn-helix domain-containing protein n=1 Tax=Streptomyces phaeochromogenes TaxID=1923 RepID=UPI00386D47E2|nr:helix-turn-helix domain-containing protein [Streptomyces phaeochromogenes]WSS99695.1 helix-turn-helix domain-containing protein [Streptomyces phaeochromogenes]